MMAINFLLKAAGFSALLIALEYGIVNLANE